MNRHPKEKSTGTQPRAKRPYSRPAIEEEQVFERRVMQGCAREFMGPGTCATASNS